MLLYRVLAVVGLGGMALTIYGFGQSLILEVQGKPGAGLAYAEAVAAAPSAVFRRAVTLRLAVSDV